MIKEKIYDYFLSKEKENHKQDGITFAPSYFSDCKRKIYYNKTGEEISNPITEAAYFKMELGNAGHEKIQSIISKLDDVNFIEYEDMKNIQWQGIEWNYRLDGFFEINDKRYIIEIKTIYGAGFRFVENEPKREHLLQLFLYMQFERITEGLLLYVGRDNGFMVEYHYNITQLNEFFSKEVKDKIKDLKDLKGMIEAEVMPDRDFQIQLKNNGINDTRSNEIILSEDFTKDKIKYKSDWQCSYCQWKNKCWNNVLEDIKDNKFYINGKFIN